MQTVAPDVVLPNSQRAEYLKNCVKTISHALNGAQLGKFYLELYKKEVNLPGCEKCSRCYSISSHLNTNYRIKPLMKNVRFLRRLLKSKKELLLHTFCQQRSLERLKRLKANMKWKRLELTCNLCNSKRTKLLKTKKNIDSDMKKLDLIKTILQDVFAKKNIKDLVKESKKRRAAKLLESRLEKFKLAIGKKGKAKSAHRKSNNQGELPSPRESTKKRKKKTKKEQFAGLNPDAVLSATSNPNSVARVQKMGKKKKSIPQYT